MNQGFVQCSITVPVAINFYTLIAKRTELRDLVRD